MEIALFGFAILLTIREVAEMYFSGVKEYLSDSWNYLDVIGYSSLVIYCSTITSLAIEDAVPESTAWVLILATICMSLRALTFLRVF